MIEKELLFHSALRGLLNGIRGKMSTSEFNVAFAALIFLRWAHFEEAEWEAIAAFEDDDYEPKSVSRLNWLDLQKRGPYDLERLIRQLPDIAEEFAKSRHSMIANAAHHAATALEKLSILPVDVVGQMIQWLAHEPFETPSDRRAIRDAFDAVLQDNPDKFAGEFFTPSQIAALMVEMVSPQQGESVYDPCFGSAGLLTTALDSVKQRKNVTLDDLTRHSLRLAGVEISSDAFVIGVTRLGLSGVSDAWLEHGNSLMEPEHCRSSEGFDVVLANPPWGKKIDLHRLEEDFPIPTKDSSSLFLQHAISKLRHGGRCVLVVPPSLLFRSGREQQLREWLLNENRVEAIVAIPKGAFRPYTSIETCILLIRRGGLTRSVRMVDSKRFFEKAGIPGSRASLPAMTPELFASSLVEMLVRSPERYDRGSDEWWDVDVETLASIDYDLTPKRRDRSDLELILDSLPDPIEIVTLDDCCEISGGRAVRSNYLVNTDYLTVEEAAAFLGVDTDTVVKLRSEGDIAGFRDGSTWKFSRKQLEKIARERGVDQRLEAMVPYVRIGDISNGVATRGSSFVAPTYSNQLKPEWKLQSGDLLLSKSGTIGKSGIVRDGAVGAIAANGFFVLRAKEGTVDPHYLLAFLQSTEANAWLEDRARGAAAKHVSLSSIKDFPVALPPLQIQQRTAEQHRKFGVDALSYLAELLSEDASDPIAAELNEWVSRSLRQIEDVERNVRDLTSEGTLNLIEEIAQSPCPINRCQDCGETYHLDFSDNHYAYPYDWAKGIDTTCLACWLDVGPGSDAVDGLAKLSPIVPWAIAFRDATSVLNRISNIPDPVGILNVLRSARTKMLSSLEKLKGHLPNEDKARQFTNKLWTLVESLEDRLLANVKIAIDVSRASELANGKTVIELNVRNKGSLPIRETSFSIKPRMIPDETAAISYLPVDDHVVLIFRGEIPPSDEKQTFVVGWTGRNLNGDSIEGSTELSVAIQRSVDEVASPSDLGTSPYICGSEPVKRERDDVFFGRDELLDQIRRQISQSGNVILLEGNRRAGKSSILWHLEGKNSVPGWLGVVCSFQGTDADKTANTAAMSTAGAFRHVAYEIVQSVREVVDSVVLPDGSILDSERSLGIARSVRNGISEDAPFSDFREYVELILKTLDKQGLGLLLMLDEFDKLQEGIDRGVTSPQVPENIRFLVQTYPRLSAILTGSRRLKRMREEYWSALFGLGTRLGVSSLPHEYASKLVTDPVKGRLTYSEKAIDLAITLTAGQPYLLQCLCNRVFDLAAQSRVRSITVDHVKEASIALVEDNEHFASLWDYTMFDRRRFLLALVNREVNGPDPLKLLVIQAKLEGHGVEIREETLISDLEYLRELELVELHGETRNAYYTLSIPMMGYWIDHQHDFDVLKAKARAESEDSDE